MEMNPPHCSIIERLSPEIITQVFSNLDTHSLRSLLRAFPSFGYLVTLVLGPEHEGNRKPLFFTGFPCKVVHCCSTCGTVSVPSVRSMVKLYEINTRSKYFQKFIDSGLKQIRPMSFIHFRGNINVMGKTIIHKILNSMQPYAPRTSFEYNSPMPHQKEKKNKTCKSLPTFATSSGSAHSEQSPHSHATFTTISEADENCTRYTSISIDDSIYSRRVENISWNHVKNLEVMFYEGDTIPIIQNIDLPVLLSFRVKYSRTPPLLLNTKLGYATKGYKVFEMIDTSAFDVHYGSHTQYQRLAKYAGVIDMSFTRNFDSFVFIGGGMLYRPLCDFSKATSLFCYDSTKLFLEYDIDEQHLVDSYNLSYFMMPHIKSFTYIIGMEGTRIFDEITIPELEVLRCYCNSPRLWINHVISRSVSAPSFQHENDHTSFKVVDICCDLRLEKIGSEDHCVIDNFPMHAILYSNKLRFLSLKGCYIGEENEGLFSFAHEAHGRIVSAVPQNKASGGGVLRKRSLELELVRKRDTKKVDQMKVLNVSVLECLATYLTSLTITQAVGGKAYTQWDGIVAGLSDGVLSDGIIVNFDSSFESIYLTSHETGLFFRMQLVDHFKEKKITIRYNGSSVTLRSWKLMKLKGMRRPWKAIPAIW